MVKLPSSERSLWREAYSGPYYTVLEGEITVDVVVVGAGITGLSAAYLLKEGGLTVAVVEKDTVGGGTTGRTTGKVTSQHNLAYAELIRMVGEHHARMYAEANQSAIAEVERIIQKNKIECDWRRSDNYVYTTNESTLKSVNEEVDAAVRLGLPASFTDTLDLPFAIKGAVRFTDQAQFTAQKYLLGLAMAINGDGSYVFENSSVTSIRDGEPCHVSTSRGSVVAKAIVVATNVPTLPLMARGGYCILEYPMESYIVATPYDGPVKHMYISPDAGQYSILPVQLGSERYLLVGGEGHLSGLRISKSSKFQKLATYAQKHFGVSQITHAWSDRDYMAYDKLPLVGQLYPWSKHIFVGTAYRKWGLANGTAAGIILRDLIINKPNPWAETYSPLRTRPLRYIPNAVVEQAKKMGSSLLNK